MDMSFRIRGYHLGKLRHCCFKGVAKKLSKELGMGGCVVDVDWGLGKTYIMGTVEYGFIGIDGKIHRFEVDDNTRNDIRSTIKPIDEVDQ